MAKMANEVATEAAVPSNVIAYEPPASAQAEGNQPIPNIKAASIADILGFNPRKAKQTALEARFTKLKRLKKIHIQELLTTPYQELHVDDQELQRKVMFRLKPENLAMLSPALAAERKRLERDAHDKNEVRCHIDSHFCQSERHEAPALRDLHPLFGRRVGMAL